MDVIAEDKRFLIKPPFIQKKKKLDSPFTEFRVIDYFCINEFSKIISELLHLTE